MNTSVTPMSPRGHSQTEHIIRTTVRHKQLIRISWLCNKGYLVRREDGFKGNFIDEVIRNTICLFNGLFLFLSPNSGLNPGMKLRGAKAGI